MRFFEGNIYKDEVGRDWFVVQTVTTFKGERLLLIRRDKLITNLWAIAIDNGDGTATVLENIGFTTLYVGDME